MLLLVNLVLVIDTYREEPKCLSQYAEKKEIEFPLIKILLRAGAPAKYFAPSLFLNSSGLLQAETAGRTDS